MQISGARPPAQHTIRLTTDHSPLDPDLHRRRICSAGDIDGMLCVRRRLTCDALARAEEIWANEGRLFGWVAEGRSAEEITEEGSYF